MVGEFVGSSSGLGYGVLLLAAGLLRDCQRVFAIMFILMAVGVSLVEISRRVEQYLLRWRPAMAEVGVKNWLIKWRFYEFGEPD